MVRRCQETCGINCRSQVIEGVTERDGLRWAACKHGRHARVVGPSRPQIASNSTADALTIRQCAGYACYAVLEHKQQHGLKEGHAIRLYNGLSFIYHKDGIRRHSYLSLATQRAPQLCELRFDDFNKDRRWSLVVPADSASSLTMQAMDAMMVVDCTCCRKRGFEAYMPASSDQLESLWGLQRRFAKTCRGGL